MPDTRYCPKCGEPCGWDDRFCTSCRTELRTTTPRPGGDSAPGPSRSSSPRAFRSDILDVPQTELGLQPNSLLADRYRIVQELGAGGMGIVYRAEDQKLAMPVAIKVLRDILRQDPGSVKRLITEAKASIMLAHPNIVRLHNFEDGETTKFLVMEFVEGETLAHKIAREGRISEEEVRRIGTEVCKGLEHAHSKKVIHRDLKPGNILLGKDGSVKVADFGIARLCRDSMSRLTAQQSSGTLIYMSPEQLDGETGELGDLYSLGVVLFEMLAGDPPFLTGEISAQIRYKAPREIPDVSPALNGIVMKCLEKKPENRYAGLRELREELDGSAERRRAQASQTEKNLELLTNRGRKALEEGRFAEAVSLWEQALALKPGDSDLESALAQAREQLANAEKTAVERLRSEQEQARRREEEDLAMRQHFESLRARGTEAFNAGRYADSIAIWREALSLNPSDSGLNASISEAQKRAAQAKNEAELKEAEEAKRKWIETILAQANAEMEHGNFSQAESRLQQALRYDPNNAAFGDMLARCRTQLQDAKERESREKTEKKSIAKRKWSKKKLILWIGAALVLLSVIAYIANEIDMADPSGYSSSHLSSGDTGGETGSKGDTGGDTGYKGDKGKIVDEPHSPASVLNLTGNWGYTVYPPNGNALKGNLVITSSGERVRIVSTITYMAPGMDGLIHRFDERFVSDGYLTGLNLETSTTSGTVLMDGIPIQAPPSTFSAQVSPDGRYMAGQVTNSLKQSARLEAAKW